jgi:hypothetical protein
MRHRKGSAKETENIEIKIPNLRVGNFNLPRSYTKPLKPWR